VALRRWRIVPGVNERTRWDAYLDGDFSIPANDWFGFRRRDSGTPKESVTFTWEVPAELCNSVGNLQGGVLAAFADALLGGASAAHLAEDVYPALVEMKISIFRPASRGATLTGIGRVVKAGTRVLFAEAEVHDADHNLIAKASGTEIPSSP
jgi:uncharacterized protein (TIGR00369 family)